MSPYNSFIVNIQTIQSHHLHKPMPTFNIIRVNSAAQSYPLHSSSRPPAKPPRYLPRCVHPFAVYFTISTAVKPPTPSTSATRRTTRPPAQTVSDHMTICRDENKFILYAVLEHRDEMILILRINVDLHAIYRHPARGTYNLIKMTDKTTQPIMRQTTLLESCLQ